jgi:hypothetical protein
MGGGEEEECVVRRSLHDRKRDFIMTDQVSSADIFPWKSPVAFSMHAL